jgi:hypothetical protein
MLSTSRGGFVFNKLVCFEHWTSDAKTSSSPGPSFIIMQWDIIVPLKVWYDTDWSKGLLTLPSAIEAMCRVQSAVAGCAYNV